MNTQTVDNARVLLVEDDATVSEVVVKYLQREGYDVDRVDDGAVAVAMALGSEPYDLIVMDLMLPGLNGREACHRIRSQSDVPIIMLTALGDAADRIAGLESGADDYMAKPFSPRELVARVNNVLRRTRSRRDSIAGQDQLVHGPISIDRRTRSVIIENRPVSLTGREYDLLSFFMSAPGEVFTREELLSSVWGHSVGDTSTVTVHVRRLREKIEPNPAEPTFVQTVWGVGYRLGT